MFPFPISHNGVDGSQRRMANSQSSSPPPHIHLPRTPPLLIVSCPTPTHPIRPQISLPQLTLKMRRCCWVSSQQQAGTRRRVEVCRRARCVDRLDQMCGCGADQVCECSWARCVDGSDVWVGQVFRWARCADVGGPGMWMRPGQVCGRTRCAAGPGVQMGWSGMQTQVGQVCRRVRCADVGGPGMRRRPGQVCRWAGSAHLHCLGWRFVHWVGT